MQSSKHLRKVENIVLEALIERGFSEDESLQIIARLSTPNGNGGGQYGRVKERGKKATFMPFGKYKGYELRDVPLDYLLWIQTQRLVRTKFYSLHDSIMQEIENRRGGGRK